MDGSMLMHGKATSCRSEVRNDYESASPPESPSPQLLDSPIEEDSILLVEGFNEICSDMKRLLDVWVQRTVEPIRAREELLKSELRAIQLERKKMMKEVEAYRNAELKKIAESRQRADSTAISLSKQISGERELFRQRMDAERLKLEEEKRSLLRCIQIQQDALDNSMKQFEAEKQKISNMKLAAASVITLNVGGTIFQTSRERLCVQPESFIASVASGRHDVSLDDDGVIFIDRDAHIFNIILNFLRKPEWVPTTKDELESEQLALDAAFYGIRFFPNTPVMLMGGYDGSEFLSDVKITSVDDFTKWANGPPFTTPRAYFASGQLLNCVYVAGGQNLEYKALCEVECFDLFRQQWRTISPMRDPRKSVCGCVAGNEFYVFGGFDGEKVLSSVEFYDPRTSHWQNLPPMICPRAGAAALSINEKLFVFGGNDESPGEYYDIRKGKWTEIKDGSCLTGAACSRVGADVVLVGGYTHEQKRNMSTYIYGTSNNKWEVGGDVPVSVCDGTLVSRSAKSGLLMGGRRRAADDKHAWEYDIVENSWTVSSVDEKRWGHTCVVVHL